MHTDSGSTEGSASYRELFCDGRGHSTASTAHRFFAKVGRSAGSIEQWVRRLWHYRPPHRKAHRHRLGCAACLQLGISHGGKDHPALPRGCDDRFRCVGVNVRQRDPRHPEFQSPDRRSAIGACPGVAKRHEISSRRSRDLRSGALQPVQRQTRIQAHARCSGPHHEHRECHRSGRKDASDLGHRGGSRGARFPHQAGRRRRHHRR